MSTVIIERCLTDQTNHTDTPERPVRYPTAETQDIKDQGLQDHHRSERAPSLESGQTDQTLVPVQEKFNRYYHRLRGNWEWLEKVANQATEGVIRTHLFYCRADFAQMVELLGRELTLLRIQNWDPSMITIDHYLQPVPRAKQQRNPPPRVPNNRNPFNSNTAVPPLPTENHQRNNRNQNYTEYRNRAPAQQEGFLGPTLTTAPRRNRAWQSSIYGEMLRMAQSLQGTYQHLEEGRIRTQRNRHEGPPEEDQNPPQDW
ncbi:hypothetical protein PCASD_12908 [Puccinia coronata f. sp. avenae]|uniref:Uncharacterized protein n=1 Tax=Puccinia coronata f. sp. avenae TaxID=200324 RepID=A0A2N5U5N6_9BASI|nr:hypothetical protein PCASD_12908 [Puccinia coronata f. sp. avenae]